MALKTLLQLRTEARQLADLENAVNRFPDSEVTGYINRAVKKVYAMVLVAMDKPFYVSEYIFQIKNPVTPGVVTVLPLPGDFLQCLSVAWCSNQASPTGPWIPLDPCEEADWVMLTNAGFIGGLYPTRYMIGGTPTVFTQGTIPTTYTLSLLPSPPQGSQCKLRYVPNPPSLVNDQDTFDGILGFEDVITTWAAILMRRKDDLDTSDLESDMVIHQNQVALIAKRRDRSRPPNVSVVRGRGYYSQRNRGNRGWGTW